MEESHTEQDKLKGQKRHGSSEAFELRNQNAINELRSVG